MRTALIVVASALAWYLIGFLSVCITNLLDRPHTYKEWLKNRNFYYKFATFGPITTIFLVGCLIGDLINGIWKAYRPSNLNIRIVKITDWMIAGFRKPPAHPSEQPPSAHVNYI